MTRVFGHGGLRLYLLKLLEDEPRYGYELIRLVEDHFLGMYTPSAGTIYPRLSALEADGLIEHDEIDGRKVYRLTDAGRAELAARQGDLHDLQAKAAESARQLAHEIRQEVRTSVRDFRHEMKQAMRDVRREERRGGRGEWSGPPGREDRSEREDGRDRDPEDREDRGDTEDREDPNRGPQDDRLAWRSLKADLSAFAGDVMAAARHHRLDATRVHAVRDALLEAREAVMQALNNERP